MKMIKRSIDYVKTWIIGVISHITYAISEHEMEEMMPSCTFYGPNIFICGHMLCLL
jgi:hypothetical protein